MLAVPAVKVVVIILGVEIFAVVAVKLVVILVVVCCPSKL